MSIVEIYDQMTWGPAPEGAETAIQWLEGYGRKFGHFIGGQFVEPFEGGYFTTLNPSKRQTTRQKVWRKGDGKRCRCRRSRRTASPACVVGDGRL